MRLKLIDTGDGAHSLYNEELDEHYHSVHGAVNEALHVFIKHGWKATDKKFLNVFEMGFGTGLNFLVTFFENKISKRKLDYYSLEKYPLKDSIWRKINHLEILNKPEFQSTFDFIHECKWNELVKIDEHSSLNKLHGDIHDIILPVQFDLVYYDAFGPRVQPDLWTERLFKKLYQNMSDNGVLVTYCAKGQVRRNLEAVGFMVERLPGPPNKREMLRAIKKIN